jgi:hypothetical protein
LPTIQEIVGRLQSADQKITETIQLLGQAENAAAQMQQQFAGMGVQDKAAQLAGVREAIKKVSQHQAGGHELATQAMTQAKQAGG